LFIEKIYIYQIPILTSEVWHQHLAGAHEEVSRTVGAAAPREEQDPDGLTGSSLDSRSYLPESVGTGVSLNSSGCRAGAETAKEENQPAERQTHFLLHTYAWVLCTAANPFLTAYL